MIAGGASGQRGGASRSQGQGLGVSTRSSGARGSAQPAVGFMGHQTEEAQVSPHPPSPACGATHPSVAARRAQHASAGLPTSPLLPSPGCPSHSSLASVRLELSRACRAQGEHRTWGWPEVPGAGCALPLPCAHLGTKEAPRSGSELEFPCMPLEGLERGPGGPASRGRRAT